MDSESLRADVEVYSHRTGVKLLGGKWVPASATFSNGTIRIVGARYDKKMEIGLTTTMEAAPTPGRYAVHFCGFNNAIKNKRLVDFKSQEVLDLWRWRFNKTLADAKSTESQRPARKNDDKRRSRAFPANVLVVPPPPVVDERANESSANDRMWRALTHVCEKVTDERRQRQGYTAGELLSLNSELCELARKARLNLKFKVRRILRAAAKKIVDDEKTFSVMHEHAKQHGIHLGAEVHHAESSVGLHNANASILETLPVLLEKNKVLKNLVSTLTYYSTKDKLSVQDAVTCLFTGRVIQTLLNIPGGLSIMLSLRKERYAFRKLCASALLCRVPLFTTRVLELLSALVLLPEKLEGYRMVRSVLKQVDKVAHWGQEVCSRNAVLTPTPEARSNESPPAFAALCELLVDGSNELATAVITLFTALCNSVHHSQGRQASLWLQAQIFHAVRTVVPLPENKSSTPVQGRRRASTVAIRKEGLPLIEADEDKEDEDEGSSSYGASLCRPLIGLLAKCEASSLDSAKLLKIGLERFLDSWDAKELDEEEACDAEIPGSAIRVEILASRISRAALLLAHADVDSALEKLGHELELASVKPITREGGDDDPLSLDLHKSISALKRLENHSASATATAAPAAGGGGGPTSPRGAGGRVASTSFRPMSIKLAGGLDAMLKRQQQPASPSPLTPLPTMAEEEVALKDDPKYAKFFKMIRLHIPVAAVAIKMSAEGLDPAVLEMNVNEPAPAPKEPKPAEAALKDDPTYGKYFKMLRMHIPRPAVEQKMTNDGLDPAVLDMNPEGPVPSKKSKEEPPAEDVAGVPLNEDPRFAKYFKMLKMHVPKMAVAAKMAAESLDASILDLDPTKPLPRGRRPSVAPEPKSKKPAEPPAFCARPPETPVRKVFLDLITDGSGTWWKPDDDGKDDGLQKIKADQKGEEIVLKTQALEELEAVFMVPPRRGELHNADAKAAAAAAVSDMAQSEVESLRKKKKAVRSLVTDACGGKRAFELSVQISGIKIPTEDVSTALAYLDPADEVLVCSPISLSILYEMFVRKLQPHEITKLIDLVSKHDKEDDALLDETSSFFVTLLRVVTRPKEKVLHLWFRATIEDRSNEIDSQVVAFKDAVIAIRQSESLKKLLRFTLALSNFLNHGTPRSNVQGVKISSLLKLRETKTTKTDTYKSLLAYAAKHADVSPIALREELPEDLLESVYTNLPRVDLRKNINDVKDEFDSASAEQAKVAQEIGPSADEAVRSGVKEAGEFMTRAKDVVVTLEEDYAELEENIDKTLAYFGEPTTTDVEEWVKDVDRFVAHYETDHRELTDAMNRKRKREALAEKQRQRQNEIEAMAKSSAAGTNGKATAGQLDKLVAGVTTGAAFEQSNNQKAPESLHSHASAWAQKLRTQTRHDTMNEDDDDDFEFEDDEE